MNTLSLGISALLLALSLGLLNKAFSSEIVRIHRSQIVAQDVELKTKAIETFRGEIIRIQDVRADRKEQGASAILSKDLIELRNGQLLSNDEIEFLLLEAKQESIRLKLQELHKVPHADERVLYADE